MWYQKEIIIKNKNRGFHLITDEIIQNFKELNNNFNRFIAFIY